MKQIRMISRYLQIGVMLVFFAACNDDYIPVDSTPQEPSGDVVQIELFTNTGEFDRPVTRTAANENDIDGSMPWVLVFRGDNNNAMFFEASRALASNNKLSVPLTKTTSKSRLIIIANPPDKFFDGVTDNQNFDKTAINAALSGKTYGQAMTILNTRKLGSPQLATPYSGGYIPMTASLNVNTINEQTTIGTPANKVQLTRMVAKVTVENTATDFKLEGFTVIGANQYGRFLQSTPLVPTGNKVNYFAQLPADPVSGISSGKDPVYIYESVAGETSVIVKGKYNGETSYYRLAFKNANNILVSIARNKWYQFKIKNVKIPGYKTPQEAIMAPPSNIMGELLVIDQNSMEITDNGQYYLGVSNSEFYVYSNSTVTNQVGVTLTTNAPAGVKASVEMVSVTPANTMTLFPLNIAPDGTLKSTDLKINMSTPFVKGTLKITVGNLVRTVKVERKPVMTWKENNLTFTPGYVAAKIESQGNGGDQWLTVSTDGINYNNSEVVRRDAAGSIYLKVSNNESKTIRNAGIVFLARKDSQGHLKLYIDQSGNPDA